jgi:hypothetical protein
MPGLSDVEGRYPSRQCLGPRRFAEGEERLANPLRLFSLSHYYGRFIPFKGMRVIVARNFVKPFEEYEISFLQLLQ